MRNKTQKATGRFCDDAFVLLRCSSSLPIENTAKDEREVWAGCAMLRKRNVCVSNETVSAK
ncbi:hypothetical protein CEE69_23755 [Rhodopirellula bahusiensis]|uniref:Uncharacterized protein n=1 Tax=Rhodopirellula bahusiensis TaxID=2014065 RepID=A0A2G1W1A2_9BACT|nr:hypothetical protein CEE69_23755 [Rhodopirellula bahusiensis]